MISKRILPILIALALIVSLLICGLGIYILKLEKTNRNNKLEIIEEKNAIKLELKELINNYNTITVVNESLREELEITKTQTDSLYKALDKTVPKLSLLRKYRSQIAKLRKEKVRLLEANDSLITVNVIMKDSLHLKDSQIAEYFKVKKELYNENLALTAEIKKRKQLSFFGTSGIGAKMKNSGKVSVSDRIKKSEKLKICTSIKPNSQLISESKKIYFKVFNPQQVLLGKLIKEKHRSKSIYYSAAHRFFYQNQRVDICKFVAVEAEEFIPGEYTVEVYLNHELQDISRFVLR